MPRGRRAHEFTVKRRPLTPEGAAPIRRARGISGGTPERALGAMAGCWVGTHADSPGACA